MTAAAELFGRLALDIVPRALGLCDRTPGFRTAGCCDRNFWHYRITDTSNARAQEAGWLFALASTAGAPPSLFAGNRNMARWARWVWQFWLETRNSDGSVCEVYPNERSFCATSFTTAAFLQTIVALDGPQKWQSELEAAHPTVCWLAANGKQQVGNQVAASLEALAIYASLTGERNFKDAAERRLQMLLQMRDANGFFSEYGGADLGYQTITMATLVRTLPFLSNSDELRESLKATARLYLEKCDASARWDPAQNSRKTQFLYPSAFVELCPEFLERVSHGLEKGLLLQPGWMDDRYCVPFAIDYLLTEQRLARNRKTNNNRVEAG